MQGRTYLCKKLDLSSRVAVVRPADLKYYTKTRDFCDVHVIGGRTAYAKHHVRLFFPCTWEAASLVLHVWKCAIETHLAASQACVGGCLGR